MQFPKLALIIILAAGFTAGQDPTNIPGYALYKAGNFRAAISALESARKDAVHKSNPQVWNLLGVAYVSAGSPKKALKPLQTAVKLAPDNGTYRGNLAYAYLLDRKTKKAREEAEKAIRLNPAAHNAYLVRARASLMDMDLGQAENDADKVIEISPSLADGYILRSQVLMARLSSRVAEDPLFHTELAMVEEVRNLVLLGIERSSDDAAKKMLNERLEPIEVVYTHFSRINKKTPRPVPAAPDPRVTNYKILKKPQASYTRAARSAETQGTIRALVLLGADGKIGMVLLRNGLGDGLDQQVRNAALAIEFEPKKIDGQPVSTLVTVDYAFNIF
jgi:tetratricopeptide (TPR) repeat protein